MGWTDESRAAYYGARANQQTKCLPTHLSMLSTCRDDNYTALWTFFEPATNTGKTVMQTPTGPVVKLSWPKGSRSLFGLQVILAQKPSKHVREAATPMAAPEDPTPAPPDLKQPLGNGGKRPLAPTDEAAPPLLSTAVKVPFTSVRQQHIRLEKTGDAAEIKRVLNSKGFTLEAGWTTRVSLRAKTKKLEITIGCRRPCRYQDQKAEESHTCTTVVSGQAGPAEDFIELRGRGQHSDRSSGCWPMLWME